MRIITAVWGVGYAAEVIARVRTAYTLPPLVVLATAPVITYARARAPDRMDDRVPFGDASEERGRSRAGAQPLGATTSTLSSILTSSLMATPPASIA